MKIVLSGVETNNKGAELMLYAILQEIERKWPDAEVYIPPMRVKQGVSYIKTGLCVRYTSSLLTNTMVGKLHLRGVFEKFHLPMSLFAKMDIIQNADWFIDGSGFVFGDQFNLTDGYVEEWRIKLKMLKENGCKVVFLPQAIGPVEKPITKRALAVLSEYSSIIMPREHISYNYLKQSGIVDMNKIKLFTDFTSLVEGKFPSGYEHLKNGICIIPNRQMINKGVLLYKDYVKLLSLIIGKARQSGLPVYLLNHEGKKDEQLAFRCVESLDYDIEVVSGLNALEVKGLIASAYMVITSRFHGLASALNSCVPCLATSWSHKYKELLNDYNTTDCILPLDNNDAAIKMVEDFLCRRRNDEMREHLKNQIPRIKEENRKMWNYVWNL